jgi:hypothetical protein
MFGSDLVTKKEETEVEVALTDGTVWTGMIFLRSDQRVLDIVNDDRRFVPFAASDGPVRVINKDVIAYITGIVRDAPSDGKVVALK